MSQEYRSAFLTTFINQLISQVPVKEPQFIEEPLPEMPIEKSEVQEPFKFQSKETDEYVPQRPLAENYGLSIQGPGQITAIREIGDSMRSPLMSVRPQTVNSDYLGKISSLLEDVEVQSIECNGPDQQVTVEKKGHLQDTPIILNEDEIKEIIQSVSKRTNMPVEENSFKAETPDFTMTAVLSKFGGTRFIVRKKSLTPPRALVNNNYQYKSNYGKPQSQRIT